MAFSTTNRVNQLLLGKEFVKYLGSVNVLLIGVGGIGCEVLKVLTQFQLESLHILDLDTIEVSNLNRQFLFRKHHRGHYKAHVAKEVLMEDYPHLKIESYSSNIRDAEFGLKFFRKFQLVIMALDNQETRSFVNKQCMIADIPLIDAGTTGYKGQSFLLKRGETRCYDCFPRSENKKSYPACTIRTLPEKPVHCIIWAKYLFTVLFSGQLEEDDDSNLLSDIAQSISEGSHSNYERGVELFKSIFETDVLRQKEGEENIKFQHLLVLKREELQVILNETSSAGISQIVEESNEDAADSRECQLVESQQNNLTKIKYLDRQDLQFLQSTHPAEVYMQIFVDSFERLMTEKAKSGCVPFEKDDNVIMKFITAACNLRCYVFGLPCQTQFQVKEVAGSIVPAIASTNSIVSGIEITETLKYLQRQFLKLEKDNVNGNVNHQNFSRKSLNSRELYIQNDLKTKVLDVNPGKNNEECLSCNVNLLPSIIECDFTAVNLGKFIEQVIDQIKKTDDKNVEEEEEDDESDDSAENNKKLKDYSISFGQYILYEDSEDMEEDEMDQNAKKRQLNFDHFFKGLADSRIIVNDYDTNAIIGSYLFCHVPGILELAVTHQIPSKDNNLTWTKLFQRQAAAEAKIAQDQKALNEKKLSVSGTGKLGDEFAIDEDEDSDDLEICQEIAEETITSLNGKRPSQSSSGQLTQGQGQNSEKKGENQDDDDDIIFEEHPSTKKTKLD